MSKYFLILLFCICLPASSHEHNEPFIDQLTRAQIWCEIVSQDVYDLSMIRHKGISQSDFLEKGKETYQALGNKLIERMNQEKEGVKVLRKLEAQIEEESRKAGNFWPVYENIIESLFNVARIHSLRNIQEQSKMAKDDFYDGCYKSFTRSSNST